VSQQHSLAGPSGTVTVNGKSFPLVAWSITEGDPFGRAGAKGWFRCIDPTFTVHPSGEVQLEVAPWEGDNRSFPAKITVSFRSRQVYEFRVPRMQHRAASRVTQETNPG
jgi:hypothetical protein